MLIGEKVRLRGLEEKDIQLAYEYMNDPDVILNLWTGIPYPVTLKQEKAWYESQKDNKNTYNFAIETLADRLYIGGCGINELDLKNGVAIVGIMIGHKDYRGKGYGTDAMRVLLDFIFNQINVNKVQLHAFAFNERAIKSYKKCGFIEEGRIRQRIFRNGKYHDEIVMGILREEYIDITNIKTFKYRKNK
ncbi:GNAT family N-acetyltransferase [Caldisalinibacter kiritimatiensis]|uniref:Ribosomal-protein-S5p-alanine acetyltransferase n=1 Tax=Caldisalinibacter kiritimatiensis TaxID=1304284 RepID=R1CD52_9FIRM|nr:GNAT family protein [Caldisalinibacter kiritimatiensis]EOD00225.1 Ribosomal-protein-S5p-alanine acetyltransferase [Caldisalinibacter kiritimatiensis]